MRKLSIDRFEGNYAICEDDERRMFAIELAELPKNAAEGDILAISDDGEITVDAEQTKRRREKIKKLQNSVWE